MKTLVSSIIAIVSVVMAGVSSGTGKYWIMALWLTMALLFWAIIDPGKAE